LDIVKKHLEGTGLYDLIDSGSAKGWGQPAQILIAKGIIADPEGNILPVIKGSYAEGLDNKEFFNASYGARAGIIDRVVSTSQTGYLARKLAYLLNTVEADLYLTDCGTKRTLDITLNSDIESRITGRYHMVRGKPVLYNKGDIKHGSLIRLRTPIYCESPKICHTCYGEFLKIHKSPYIGIVASQVISERSTQLIMRNFHLGGAVNVVKKDILKDIKNNDPHADL